jgi:hypothetical protein
MGEAGTFAVAPSGHRRDRRNNWRVLAKAACRHHRLEAVGVYETPRSMETLDE